MFRKHKLYAFLAAIAIFLTGLACNFSMSKVATEIPANPPAPTATADIRAVETQLSAAVATGVSGGKVTLELTEDQLTEIAHQELLASGESSIQNLNIRLSDGVIIVSGDASQDGLTLPVVISMKINVNAEGRPHTEVISGKLGPFPLPNSLLDQMMSQFDQALQAELDSSASNLVVEEITILNGRITIVAQSR